MVSKMMWMLAAASIMSCGALGGPVRADAPPEDETLVAAALVPIAYDILMVPRDPRATRSRLWTDRGWVTLPDRTDGRLLGRRPDDVRARRYVQPWGNRPSWRDGWSRRDPRDVPAGRDRRWGREDGDRRWRGMEAAAPRWSEDRRTSAWRPRWRD